MNLSGKSKIPEILQSDQAELLTDWISEQMAAGIRKDLIKEVELREECREFLDLFSAAVQQGNFTDIKSTEWRSVR